MRQKNDVHLHLHSPHSTITPPKLIFWEKQRMHSLIPTEKVEILWRFASKFKIYIGAPNHQGGQLMQQLTVEGGW